MQYKLMVSYKCNPGRGVGSGFDEILEVTVKSPISGGGTTMIGEPMRDLDWYFESREERDDSEQRLRSTIKDIEVSTFDEEDEEED